MNATKRRPDFTLYYIQLGAALLGIAASLYLLIQHTRLKSGIQGSASFCALGKFSDCDVVNASQYSEIAGVSLAAFGTAFYFLLFLLGLLSSPKSPDFRKFQRLMAWLGLAGMAVDVGLFSVSIGILRNLCAVCFVTYLVTLTHWVATLMLARPSGAGWKESFYEGMVTRGEQGAPIKIASSKVWAGILCFAFFVTVLAFLPTYIRSKAQSYTIVDTALEQYYAQWKDRAGRNIEISPGDATFGNPNAKVKIIEFSDFECPFCRKAAFTLHTFLKAMEGRIYFVFKNYPLDSSCNPSVPYQLHPNACLFARLGTCATKKKQFWAFHDLIFFTWGEEHRSGDFDTIANTLKSVFTRDEMTACLRNEASLAAVSENIKQGNALEVKGTPAIFINGKMLSNIPVTVETLRHLVEIEEKLR